jgi:hypothetical protein
VAEHKYTTNNDERPCYSVHSHDVQLVRHIRNTMGILDHFSDLCSITETKEALKLRKKRPLQVSEELCVPFVFLDQSILQTNRVFEFS